jgi:hypothetical protein
MNRRRAKGGGGRAGQLRRGALIFLRALAAVGMAAFVTVGSVKGWEWLHRSDRFAVKSIVFHGLTRASEDDLLHRSGLVTGENIFQTNTAGAASAMEQADWVAHVRVVRSWPETIQVFVDERRPTAVANAGPLFVVDDEGTRIKGVAAADHLDLTVLSGLPADDFGGDDHPASRNVLAALDLLRAYQAHRVGKVAPLSELHFAMEGGENVFTAFCGDDPAVEARLGAFETTTMKEVSPVLDRLDRMLGELAHEGRRARSLDLGNRQRPDWVPARLEAPQVAARLGTH